MSRDQDNLRSKVDLVVVVFVQFIQIFTTLYISLTISASLLCNERESFWLKTD